MPRFDTNVEDMLPLPSGRRLFAALLIFAAVVMPGCSEDSETVIVTPAPPAAQASLSASLTPAATTKVTGTPTMPAPSPMPTQVLADVRPGRLTDLYIVRGGENGAGQHMMYSVLIGNRAPTPCVLATFTLFDGARNVIPVEHDSGPEPAAALLLKPGLGPPRAHEGRPGQAGFIFTSVTSGLCEHPGPVPSSAMIGIPGDPAAVPFHMALDLPQICNGRISVGPIVPLR